MTFSRLFANATFTTLTSTTSDCTPKQWVPFWLHIFQRTSFMWCFHMHICSRTRRPQKHTSRFRMVHLLLSYPICIPTWQFTCMAGEPNDYLCSLYFWWTMNLCFTSFKSPKAAVKEAISKCTGWAARDASHGERLREMVGLLLVCLFIYVYARLFAYLCLWMPVCA